MLKSELSDFILPSRLLGTCRRGWWAGEAEAATHPPHLRHSVREAVKTLRSDSN